MRVPVVAVAWPSGGIDRTRARLLRTEISPSAREAGADPGASPRVTVAVPWRAPLPRPSWLADLQESLLRNLLAIRESVRIEGEAPAPRAIGARAPSGDGPSLYLTAAIERSERRLRS
jgi:hypothetical protein